MLSHARLSRTAPLHSGIALLGAGCRNRTRDNFITSEVLYQLS